jgi:hypothetical protein
MQNQKCTKISPEQKKKKKKNRAKSRAPARNRVNIISESKKKNIYKITLIHTQYILWWPLMVPSKVCAISFSLSLSDFLSSDWVT